MSDDILIVADEAIREPVSRILQGEGFVTRSARDSDDALAHVASSGPSLVLLDIWLQDSRLDGLQLLEKLKAQHPELPVVMISAHGTIETAVTAIRQGASDFIEKPFKADRLVLATQRALQTSRLKRAVKALEQPAPSLVGKSLSMNQLRQVVERISPTNTRVLIVGPTGAGKELTARSIHSHSARAKGPFIMINATAMTPEQMDIELFGVERRTNELGHKTGALEEAHGGTLFINEIADMPPETQNKILRVLIEQTFQRIGGTNKVQSDVRIISSTARNLEAEVAAGKFREDLFHRISVVPIRVPSLVEHREDIPDLVEYFMDEISRATGLPKRVIGEDAMGVMQSHDWPGNVRQLRNNVERLMILAGGDPDAVINADMLPPDLGSMVPAMPRSESGEYLMGLPLRDAREVFEREYLAAQISRFGGNIDRMAEFVRVEPRTLYRKLRSIGVGDVVSDSLAVLEREPAASVKPKKRTKPAPLAKRSTRDSAEVTAASFGPKRTLNAWISKLRPKVGEIFRVSINIGVAKDSSVASVGFVEPDWRDQDSIDLIVAISCFGCSVVPSWQKLRLPRTGDTEKIEFRITATMAGDREFSVSVFLAKPMIELQSLRFTATVVPAQAQPTTAIS